MLYFCVPVRLRAGKGWLVMYLILLPNIDSFGPVHDVTDSDTVMQTAGHSSHGHVFSPLSNMDLEQTGSQVKNCCVYILGSTPYQLGLWCFFGLIPL